MSIQSKQQTLTDFQAADTVSRDSSFASKQTQGNSLPIQLLRSIPNRVVLAICLIGFIAEMIGLAQVQTPLFFSGWRLAMVSTLFAAWFWLTIGLSLHKLSIRLLALKSKSSISKAILFCGGCSLLLAGMIGMYAISWGIFLKTARFANWESLRFMSQNVGELFSYITSAEPIHLLYCGIVLVAAFAGLWGLLKPISIVRYAEASRALPFNRLWLYASFLTLIALIVLLRSTHAYHTQQNLMALKHGLNPLVTLTGTSLDSFFLGSIDQVIVDPENELTPLNETWLGEINREQLPTKLPSIVMIQVESLRHDVVYAEHQGREVMPCLNKLAKNSLVWKNAYAHSTHSDYADPCIVSSLYPLRTRNHHYYTLADPWPKQMSYDCLSKIGYATATISSQNEMWSGMEHFLDSPSLDFFYHPERPTGSSVKKTAPTGAVSKDVAKDIGFHQSLESGVLKAGKFTDRHTTDVAIDWIEHRVPQDQPFLLNMNLQSSHFPYLIPAEASQVFQPCEIPANASFAWYDPNDTEAVRNAYYNSLHEIDVQLGRLIQTLRDNDRLDDTIVVVLGENGESFHENQQVCHANKPYDPAIHIATVMHCPKWLGKGEEDYPLEHIDILPTLFNKIGVKPHSNFQGIDALAVDRPQLTDRFLFCHTNSPISEVDAVQWAGRWKYMHDRQFGRSELYNLAADPKEKSNVVGDFPELATVLGNQLQRWRSRQLAWYHYPQLYQNYFPPTAPTADPKTQAFLDKFLIQGLDANRLSHQDRENH